MIQKIDSIVYGIGEGLQGNSYGLPTKDLRVRENHGYRSISKEQIISFIENKITNEIDINRKVTPKEFPQELLAKEVLKLINEKI